MPAHRDTFKLWPHQQFICGIFQSWLFHAVKMVQVIKLLYSFKVRSSEEFHSNRSFTVIPYSLASLAGQHPHAGHLPIKYKKHMRL